jgi:hypothetical protein
VRNRLALLHSINALLIIVAALVRKLRVVFDVRDADLGVVAVEDAGDFFESGTPVRDKMLVKVAGEWGKKKVGAYLVST